MAKNRIVTVPADLPWTPEEIAKRSCTVCEVFYENSASLGRFCLFPFSEYSWLSGTGEENVRRRSQDEKKYWTPNSCWTCTLVYDFVQSICEISKHMFYALPGQRIMKTELSIQTLDYPACQIYQFSLARPTPRIVTEALEPKGLTELSLEWTLQRLSHCMRHHHDCQSVSAYMPHRLLDVSRHRVYVRTHSQDAEKYVTLSHRWQQSYSPNLLQKLNTANVDNLTSAGFSIDSLPATYRGAIQLTRRLGVKYIWIDSLCIVQDDRDDWSRESSRMADIYENAFLGIFASKGSDVEGDVFSCPYQDAHETNNWELFRSAGRRDPPLVYVQEHRSCQHATGSCIYPATSETLFSRGWVFQEYLLVPRALLFNEEELVWSCHTETTCECGWYDTADLSSSLAKRVFHDFVNAPGLNAHRCLFTWKKLVENYTRMSLTYDADRLPAFSGFAKAFARTQRISDSYLAGFWRGSLKPLLLWQNNGDYGQRMPSRPASFHTPGPPSWSWASCSEGVGVKWASGFQQFVAFDILDCQCILAGKDPTGRVVGGSLVLSGVLHSVSLKYADPADNIFLARAGSDTFSALFLPDYDFMSTGTCPDCRLEGNTNLYVFLMQEICYVLESNGSERKELRRSGSAPVLKDCTLQQNSDGHDEVVGCCDQRLTSGIPSRHFHRVGVTQYNELLPVANRWQLGCQCAESNTEWLFDKYPSDFHTIVIT